MKVSDGGFVLVSIFDKIKGDIFYVYLDNTGQVLWEKEIDSGYPLVRTGSSVLYDGNPEKYLELSDDGFSFKIFSMPENRWYEFVNGNGVVLEKKSN